MGGKRKPQAKTAICGGRRVFQECQDPKQAISGCRKQQLASCHLTESSERARYTKSLQSQWSGRGRGRGLEKFGPNFPWLCGRFMGDSLNLRIRTDQFSTIFPCPQGEKLAVLMARGVSLKPLGRRNARTRIRGRSFSVWTASRLLPQGSKRCCRWMCGSRLISGGPVCRVHFEGMLCSGG